MIAGGGGGLNLLKLSKGLAASAPVAESWLVITYFAAVLKEVSIARL